MPLNQPPCTDPAFASSILTQQPSRHSLITATDRTRLRTGQDGAQEQTREGRREQAATPEGRALEEVEDQMEHRDERWVLMT